MVQSFIAVGFGPDDDDLRNVDFVSCTREGESKVEASIFKPSNLNIENFCIPKKEKDRNRYEESQWYRSREEIKDDESTFQSRILKIQVDTEEENRSTPETNTTTQMSVKSITTVSTRKPVTTTSPGSSTKSGRNMFTVHARNRYDRRRAGSKRRTSRQMSPGVKYQHPAFSPSVKGRGNEILARMKFRDN